MGLKIEAFAEELDRIFENLIPAVSSKRITRDFRTSGTPLK